MIHFGKPLQSALFEENAAVLMLGTARMPAVTQRGTPKPRELK